MKKKIKDLTFEEFRRNWSSVNSTIITMVLVSCGNDEEKFNKFYPKIVESCPDCIKNQEIEVNVDD